MDDDGHSGASPADAGDARPGNGGRETGSNDIDLGKLWHGELNARGLQNSPRLEGRRHLRLLLAGTGPGRDLFAGETT